MKVNTLRSDMVALGFEEVPTPPACAWQGNRDFQRGATLIRFWCGYDTTLAWVHVVHTLDDAGLLREAVDDGHGTGVAALAVYLKKRVVNDLRNEGAA